MKNINWKKYAGAAMAAAMIPAVVAPIATEAASGTFAVTQGTHIVITVDGKTLTGQESLKLFKEKQIKVVDAKTKTTYYANANGVIWVPATYGVGTVYDVHDQDGKKASMTVWPKGTTKAVVKYSTAQETKTVKAADVDFTNNSNAYHLDNTGKGIYTDSTAAKLIVDGKETGFQRSMTAHAPAIIEYDLTGKNFSRFTSYVGLDARRDFGTLQVEVYVDNELYDSFVQDRNDEAKFLNIDLKDKQTLKFVVTGKTETNIPKQNPNQNAMVVLGDAEFVQEVKTIK